MRWSEKFQGQDAGGKGLQALQGHFPGPFFSLTPPWDFAAHGNRNSFWKQTGEKPGL
ncbi:MAG: hypothetical protein KKA60_03420 [Proteobacteria bacterium]|nr:hypothetical protein [Pseudomonadota bacterium]